MCTGSGREKVKRDKVTMDFNRNAGGSAGADTHNASATNRVQRLHVGAEHHRPHPTGE
jgi:hypothetical protein